MSIKCENVIIKKTESKINNFGILSENNKQKNRKKETVSHVVDEILISGLQHLKQYHKLNPINIKVDDSQIISSLSKYGNYRLKMIR